MLTKRQRELLEFIDCSTQESGIAPSFKEMAIAVGSTTTATIHRLVCGLEERGAIRVLRRNGNMLPRAIEVLRDTRIDRATWFRFDDETKTLERDRDIQIATTRRRI